MKLRQLLEKDWQSTMLSRRKPSAFAICKAILLSFSFRVIVRLRLSQALITGGFLGRHIAMSLYRTNCSCGVDIAPQADIGPGVRMAHPAGIVIGASAEIGKNVRIGQGVTIGGNTGKVRPNEGYSMPRVGDYCVLAPGSKVLGPIVVGKAAIIGANAVATRDVDSLTVVAGIPAQPLRTLTRETFFPAHYQEMADFDEIDSEDC